MRTRQKDLANLAALATLLRRQIARPVVARTGERARAQRARAARQSARGTCDRSAQITAKD